MESYIDIHSHILPGIDDGAKDSFMSMKMLETASDNGITQIIVTPHNKPARHNASPQKMRLLISELEENAVKKGMKIKLYAGNELYYRSSLTEEIMEGKVLTMAGSDYVLVEFGPMDDYDYIRNGIYSLLAGGYHPILAHVERYSKCNGRTDRVEDLIKMGCYIQINAGSLMGAFGFGTKIFTRKLLKEHLVHFVATDAHDLDKRSPQIRECASFIKKKFGEDYKRELLYENPMHVILNEYL